MGLFYSCAVCTNKPEAGKAIIKSEDLLDWMEYLKSVILKKIEYEENITREPHVGGVFSMHKTIEGIITEKPC